MNPILRFAEYASLRFVAFVVAVLPLSVLRFGARRFGAVLYYVVPIRRRVAVENIRRAFPEIENEECFKILRSSYNNLCTLFFELVKTRSMSSEELVAQWKWSGIELMKSATQGAVLLSAHFSNWEWLAISGALNANKKVLVVTKEQHNSNVDEFINSLRMRFGNSMIAMNNIRGMITHLRSGGLIAMLGDQSASEQSVETIFFGEALPTFAGAATLALKLNVPLVFGVAHRMKDGTYTAHLHEVPREGCEEYSKENVIELTQRHVTMLEEEIRRSPGEWLWLHKRWKHSKKNIS